MQFFYLSSSLSCARLYYYTYHDAFVVSFKMHSITSFAGRSRTKPAVIIWDNHSDWHETWLGSRFTVRRLCIGAVSDMLHAVLRRGVWRGG